MRFKQVEFLRKEFDKIYWRLRTHGTDSSNRSDIMASNIVEIREGLTRMASIFGTALKTIEDDMNAKEQDSWEQEIEELSEVFRRSLKEDEEAWVIPFCISELQNLNEKLSKYTPSNPELAKLDVRDVVFKLSIEMQMQNNVLMTTLRHLMGKTEKTEIEKSELR
jgi:hypothetical protein